MDARILILLFIITATEGISQRKPELVQTPASLKPLLADSLTYRIVACADSTFGYIVFRNRALLIRQLRVPGVPGSTGFARRDDAGKVACLVIRKIKQGIFPPTVTIEELERLKIKVK